MHAQGYYVIVMDMLPWEGGSGRKMVTDPMFLTVTRGGEDAAWKL
jgi:hypothetical protein